MVKKDLRRINNERFSIRTVNILKALGVKTVYSAKRLNWNALVGTCVKANGYRVPIGRKTRDEVMNFVSPSSK